MKKLVGIVLTLLLFSISAYAEQGYVKRVESWPNYSMIVLEDVNTGTEMVNTIDATADAKSMLAIALTMQAQGGVLQLYVVDGCTGWCVAKATRNGE